MDLATLFGLAEATAVVVAVTFGILQVRQIRHERRRQAAFELMRSLQTPAMLHALLLLDSLSPGRGSEEIERHFETHPVDLPVLLGTWEKSWTPRKS